MFDLKAESRAIAHCENLDWDKLAGKQVLVTGATGLVGSAFVRALLERNRDFNQGIQVLALVRDIDRGRKTYEGYDASDGLHFIEGDVAEVDKDSCAADFYLHAACPTASRFFMQHPVETAQTIVCGTTNMLEAARSARAESFVYVSSMEMYGDGNSEPGLEHLLTEDDAGYVNPLSVRSCYPEGKRMAEQLCCSYATEYQIPAKIARLAQTFGPGIPKDDSRIFALIARNAMNGVDTVLKTTGGSTRMYAYIADAVTALLCILTRGENGTAYNVANPNTYSSVREMAELVAASCANKPTSVILDVDPDAPYPPEHHLPLDVSRLLSLGWQPETDLLQMYRNLIAYLMD